jgi:type II secretory pathway component PulF
MLKRYQVKGVNPSGRVVQLILTARSAGQARAEAAEAGLRAITAKEVGSGARCPADPSRAQEDAANQTGKTGAIPAQRMPQARQ